MIFCKLSSNSQTRRPVTTLSVCTSYIGPVRGVCASYGVDSGAWFGFSPSNGLFLSLIDDILNIIVIFSKGETRRLCSQFQQVTLVPCEVYVPLTGSFGGWFGFSPFKGFFLKIKSMIFCKLSSYSQIGRPATMRSVRTSYIGSVRGCSCLLRGLFGGLIWAFTLKRLVFNPNLRILKLSSYSQIERSGTTRSVHTSYIDPMRGLRASYGTVWGWFGFSPFKGLFLSFVDIF